MDQPRQTPPPFNTPLSAFASLGSALKIYLSNLNTLLVIVAIFVVPATILTVLAVRVAIGDDLLSIDPNTQDNPFQGMERSKVISLIAAFIVGAVLNLVISMVATGACFRAIHEALLGKQPDWKSSIRAALDKVRSLIWLPILLGLLFLSAIALSVVSIAALGAINDQIGAIAGLFLFGLLVYLFVSWSVAIPVLMTEDRRGMDAVNRSYQLVKGSWWPVFGVFVMAFVLIVVVSAVLNGIFNPAARTGDEGLVLSTLSSVVSNVIFTPFQAALVGVVYFNLALKKGASGAPGSTPVSLGPPPPPPAVPPGPG